MPLEEAEEIATKFREELAAYPKDMLDVHSLRINTTKRLRNKKVEVERNRAECEAKDQKRESEATFEDSAKKSHPKDKEILLPSRKFFFLTTGELLTPPVVEGSVKKIQNHKQGVKDGVEDIRTLKSKLKIVKKRDSGSSLVQIPYEVIGEEVLRSFEQEFDDKVKKTQEVPRVVSGTKEDQTAVTLADRRGSIAGGSSRVVRGKKLTSPGEEKINPNSPSLLLSKIKLGEEKHRLLVEVGLVEDFEPEKVVGSKPPPSSNKKSAKGSGASHPKEGGAEEAEGSGGDESEEGDNPGPFGAGRRRTSSIKGEVADTTGAGRASKNNVLTAITSMAVARQQQQHFSPRGSIRGQPALFRDVAVQNVLSDEASLYRHSRAQAMYKKEDAIRTSVHTLQVGLSNITSYLEGAEVDLSCHRCWSVMNDPYIVSPCGISHCRHCLIQGDDELPTLLGSTSSLEESSADPPGGPSTRENENAPDARSDSPFSRRKLVCACERHDGSAPNALLASVIQTWKVESQPKLLSSLEEQLQGLVTMIGSSSTARRPAFSGGLLAKLRTPEASEKARKAKLRLTSSGVSISDPHR